MDHLAISLLNTARQAPDPLASALGAARWWASVQDAASALPLRPGGKPRFGAALAAELRHLRDGLEAALEGAGEPELRFTGTAADQVLFAVAHAAAALLASERRSRLKRCVRQPCSALFLDETKNGSRRWCSLRCMERARAPRRRTIVT
jgi:predicted RNA-binding Zn ribbon-like protein